MAGPMVVGRRTQRAYDRLWASVSECYGEDGKPAPKLVAVPPGSGYAYTLGVEREGRWVPAERAVFANPTVRRRLRSPFKRLYNDARFTVLHEWGHLFGPGGSGPAGSEGEANRAANIALRHLNRRKG